MNPLRLHPADPFLVRVGKLVAAALIGLDLVLVLVVAAALAGVR